MKILMDTVQVKNAKYRSYLMISLLICFAKIIQPIVKELFITSKKRISLVFITQSYFDVKKILV